MMKAFRPPLLKTVPPISAPGDEHPGSPSAKRRRLNCASVPPDTQIEPRLIFKTPGISSLPRKPLQTVTNIAISSDLPYQQQDGGSETYYSVLWYGKSNEPQSAEVVLKLEVF